MIVIEERIICRMLEGLFQFGKECEWNDAIEEAMHRFVNLPTIEAEPVVRCKDCKHLFDGEHNANCCELLMEKTKWITEITVDENWYCPEGERRTDAIS